MEAVIFDFDGVLVDSHETINNLFVQVANDMLGLDMSLEEFKQWPGLRFEDRWKKLASKRGIAIDESDMQKALEKSEYEYYTNQIHYVKLFEGAEKLLASLKNAGKKVALGTNGGHSAKKQLSLLGIENYFDTIVTFDDVAHGKPAPDIFMRAAELLHLDYDECIVVEDSVTGLTAAKEAGMKVVAVSTTTDVQNLKDADIIVATVNDLTVEVFEQL